MSDYIPNPPNPERDPRTQERVPPTLAYEEQSGRGLTLIVGILVAIALAAGLMFFASGPTTGERTNQAQAPVTTERPAPPAAPAAPALPPTAPERTRTPQ